MNWKIASSIAALLATTGMASVAVAAAQPAANNAYVAVDRPVTITAIPGVVAGGGKWETVYSSLELQDGLVGTADGGLLMAQQDTEIVRKMDPSGAQTILLGGTKGAGALAQDRNGRLFAVVRREPFMTVMLAPEARTVAPAAPNSTPGPRVSDLVVDARGGIYTTGTQLDYINPQGVATRLPDEGLRTNGIALSLDGKTLFVTNNAELVAFDVGADGSVSNRRVWAGLGGDTFGDGMAVDAAGRVYVTALTGIHVFSPQGQKLGHIPTVRRPTSIAFSGRDRKTLYLLVVGATRTDGTLLPMGGPVTGNSRTLYKLPMLAQGMGPRR